MSLNRKALTDSQWKAIKPYGLGKPVIRDKPMAMLAYFWKEFCGLCEPDLRGETFRRNSASCNAEKYKWRHLVEKFFQKLKGFKGIAMRACKNGFELHGHDLSAASVIRTR
jgi:transposase